MPLTSSPSLPARVVDLSDEILMRRVAALDVTAFEAVFDRHSSVAFTLAMRMLGSPTRAEDVVQEAFLGLWRGAGRFDPAKGSPRAWLLSVVHHRAIDALRRHGVHERRRADADGMDHLPAAHADVDAEVIRRAEAGRVRAALADLPAIQRQALELAYYGGRSQSEIATALGVPLGTIKGRTRAGLMQLNEHLSDLADAPG